MKNVIIVGANARTARQTTPRLAEQADVALTLFARHPQRLSGIVPEDATLVDGDAHDQEALRSALAAQDIVIVALGGPDLDETTTNVVHAAEEAGARRIITINAGGIYDELPEPFNSWDFERAGRTRPINLRAAEAVEQSWLDYTILRPVWLTDADVTDVQLTQKGETYKGTETSRASLGTFIASLVADPSLHAGENLGITQPGTDGDKPTAYR